MTTFSKGVGDMGWAAGLLMRTPRLWGFVLAPMLVAALLAIAALFFFFGPLMDYADGLISGLPGWLSFLGSLLHLIIMVAVVGAAYVLFLAATALCTAPFCEQLSESVEATLTGQGPPDFSLKTLLKDLLLGIDHSLRRITSYLLTMGALFLAALFVPIIGAILFSVGGLWVTIRFTAYDALDAVWARKSLSYQDKMANLAQVRSRAYGIGAVTTLLMIIPLANFLAMPLAAAAATRLHVEEIGS